MVKDRKCNKYYVLGSVITFPAACKKEFISDCLLNKYIRWKKNKQTKMYVNVGYCEYRLKWFT